MSDENAGQTPASNGEGQTSTPSTKDTKVFDETYVRQLREEAKASRIKLAEYETKQSEIDAENQAAETKRLEQQNKFEELYKASQSRVAELEPLQEQVNAFTEQIKARNERTVSNVPESMRSLIPDFGDSPQQLSAWLETNAELLSNTPNVPKLDGGRGNAGGRTPAQKDVLELSELKRQASNLGVDWRTYARLNGYELDN